MPAISATTFTSATVSEKAREPKAPEPSPCLPPCLLVTEKLCKTFSQGGLQQHVLKNLDLEVRQGDFTVIMGASGAGKSTLLYLLSGMDRPSLGSVRFAGEQLEQMSNDRLAVFRRRHCGFVFQQIYLMDNMSLMDNVMASGLLLTRSRRQVAERAVELFGRVGLTRQDWCKFPAQLSGGEAQRGAIVRALINNPTVLFADEPTGSLNSAAGTAVLDLLSELHRDGQTVVMVTHDLRSACRGNRVLYLRDGVICGEQLLGAYEGEVADVGGGNAVRAGAGVGKPAGDGEREPTGTDARRTTLTGFLARMGW